MVNVSYAELGKWQVCKDIQCQAVPDANINPNVSVEPNSIIMEYKHSNEVCCEALVHITCDPSNGTCRELSAWPSSWPDDMGAHSKVAVVPRPSDGYWFFTGYGMDGGLCSLKGYIYEIGTGSYKCVCDGASNCNLTSNLGLIVYYPARDYVIAGGHCGGRWAWVFKRNGLDIVGRFSESNLRTFNAGGNIYIHPVSGSTSVIVTIGRTYTRGQYFRIGVVDLEEVIKNLANMPSVDQLSSWKELYKTNQYAHECVPHWTIIPVGGTRFYVGTLVHTGSGPQTVVVGPIDVNGGTNPSVNMLKCANPVAIAPDRFACISGNTVYIYDASGNQRASVTINDDINANHYGFAWPYVVAYNSNTRIAKLYVITFNGKAIVPVVDENNQPRLYDLVAGDFADDYVYYIGSPLAVDISRVGTLPVGNYNYAKTPLTPTTSNDVDKAIVFVPKVWGDV